MEFQQIMQPPLRQDGWVRDDELADMLNVSPRTVRENLQKLEVPTFQFGGKLLVYMPLFYDSLVKNQGGTEAHQQYQRLVEIHAQKASSEAAAVPVRGRNGLSAS